MMVPTTTTTTTLGVAIAGKLLGAVAMEWVFPVLLGSVLVTERGCLCCFCYFCYVFFLCQQKWCSSDRFFVGQQFHPRLQWNVRNRIFKIRIFNLVLGFLGDFDIVLVVVLPLLPVLFLATNPTPHLCSTLSKRETWQNKTRRTNFGAVCKQQSNDHVATGQTDRTTSKDAGRPCQWSSSPTSVGWHFSHGPSL